MKEKTLYTNCGMWSLWDHEEYKKITSYEEWEQNFLEEKNILTHIKQSTFVPIYIHTNGVFQFGVKINCPLSERENKYVIAKSEEYLFKTEGTAYLSGIECIGEKVTDTEGLKLSLKKGLYAVTIHIIEWDQEPGMRLEDGSASPKALPDFIVLINQVKEESKNYRTKIDTFNN